MNILLFLVNGHMPIVVCCQLSFPIDCLRVLLSFIVHPYVVFNLQHMNDENILNAVSIEKDVDGFHPLNIGRLAMQGREPFFVPCTPKGCMELLHRYGVEIKGKRAVVIGRSNIVGMPAALFLQV